MARGRRRRPEYNGMEQYPARAPLLFGAGARAEAGDDADDADESDDDDPTFSRKSGHQTKGGHSRHLALGSHSGGGGIDLWPLARLQVVSSAEPRLPASLGSSKLSSAQLSSAAERYREKNNDSFR